MSLSVPPHGGWEAQGSSVLLFFYGGLTCGEAQTFYEGRSSTMGDQNIPFK